MLQDLRFGLRMLLKNPGFTAVAVLTLALGIGANTAMFSVLNTYLFRSLPYPDSNRLVRIFRTSPHSQSWPHSQGNFFDYREKNDVFESMTAYTWISPSLAEEGQPAERLRALAVTADFFPSLGVQPLLGRTPTPEEADSNSSRVVVLSNSFWMRRFGGDPNVVGTTLRLNGEYSTVIGVMPRGFEYPMLWGSLDYWTPLTFPAEQRRARGSNWLQAFGKLKPGVEMPQAEQAMAVLAGNFADENLMVKGESLRLEPLQRSLSDDIGRKVMWFTFGLAGFVLLIACGNLANLQLVRSAARSREFAIRAALGARRVRLLRQSLTESLAVSLIGGALSLVLAQWSVEFISRRLFSQLPGANVSLDLTVFGFALATSVITGLIFGTVPAWLSSRIDVNQSLRDNARGSTAGRGHNRLRHLLIAGEVAFALILLAGAALFLRGLQRFVQQDPGWRVAGLVTAQIRPQGSNYSNENQRRAFLQQLEERMSAIPGVESMALAKSQPAWGFGSSGSIIIEGQPLPEAGQLPEVFMEPVSNSYVDTLGLRLLEGRSFNSTDAASNPPVILINEAMARRFWPGESPIGKRIGREGQNPEWQQVVGVINDVGFPAGLGDPYTRFQTLRPVSQAPWGGGWTILLRSSRPAEALATDLRSVISGLDRELPIYDIRTVREVVDRGLGSVSLLATLLGAFAALGLVLAAIGIYGVTSYSVAQRTGEIGIRMALGAQRKDVLWLVLGQGARLMLVGSMLGLIGAFGVAKLLLKLVPSLPTTDPVTVGVVTVVLVLVALLACYIPARRATKVDPMVALRFE